MMSGGLFWQKIILLVTIATTCEALTCMRCQNGTDPRVCRTVANCGQGEACYVEEVITASGQTVFHSGCMSHTQCSFHSGATPNMVIGKRAVPAITTCLECCTGSNCNVGGCGKTVLPLSQRGPYCFTCTHTSVGQTCNQVTQCPHGEICGLYTPRQYLNSPEVVFEGTCMSKPMCSAIHGSYVSTRCVPTCCDTDYCNVGCNSSHSHLTTQPPRTHLPTQPPGTHRTTQPPGTHLTTQSPGTHLTTQSPGTHLTTQSPGTHLTTQSPGTHLTTRPWAIPMTFTLQTPGMNFGALPIGAPSSTVMAPATIVAPVLGNCAKDSACDKCPVSETAELGTDHMKVCCHGCGPHLFTFDVITNSSNEIIPVCSCDHNGTVV